MIDPRPLMAEARDAYAAQVKLARACGDKPAADALIARINDIDQFWDAMPSEARHATTH